METVKTNNEIVAIHFAIHRPRDTLDAPLTILICTIRHWFPTYEQSGTDHLS